MEIENNKLEHYISLAKQGNQAAFSYLLDTFWSYVYGYQLKRIENELDAEEVTIQTFSKAFDKISTFKENYTFKTWLITISRNIHIDIIRKRNAHHRRALKEATADNIRKIADETPTIEDKLINEQHLAQLLNDIKKLKPHYQEVINLRYFNEKSYKEIAEELNEPLSNVKVRLLRAKKLLAELITQRSTN
ncbi:sigma-70 family RNA polymerase sigma factor [Gangjinia marincola]|uniref:Sigma-70 family RNA polymerase sigma factor n=1 Tax=Gangjinia marincola TaxID=578463 RepID=A0ABP3XUS9_9FLAO